MTAYMLIMIVMVRGDTGCGCKAGGTKEEGVCVSGLGCGTVGEVCNEGQWLCGGCQQHGVDIGPPPQMWTSGGTNSFERGVRIELKSYGVYTWDAKTSCSVAGEIGRGLSLTSPWKLSFGEVDWKGEKRLLTDLLPPHTYREALSRCSALGGRLASLLDYKYSQTAPVSSLCEGCWVGYTDTPQCLAVSGDGTTVMDCTEKRSSRCYRLDDTGKGDLALQVLLKGNGSDPVSSYPLFAYETKDEFTARIIEVLTVAFSTTGLPLVPHGTPHNTVHVNPPETWHVRRFRIDFKNSESEWKTHHNKFVEVLRTTISADAQWVLYTDVTSVDESVISISFGFMTKTSSSGLLHTTPERLSEELTPASLNKMFSELESVKVHKIRFSNPIEVPKQTGAEINLKKPSDLIPTVLLVAIASFASAFVAAYVWKTLKIVEDKAAEEHCDDAGHISIDEEDHRRQRSPSVMESPIGLQKPRRSTIVMNDNPIFHSVPTAIDGIEMAESVDNSPTSLSPKRTTRDPPPSVAARAADREAQSTQVLGIMAQLGINPLLSGGARAFKPSPTTTPLEPEAEIE
eukprot:TRINITY_DN23005_c0_g1_i1.p1 TRINITY_DN23005_c0_g1~~TRINITY_DN23005_c0_g1_i1.p1  ORF type:complete len:571 (+),score=59.79 TRINITY_DN23005_c0_g1_i1:83-1795(+)